MELPTDRRPIHPGKILLEEFLVPLGITQAAFARHLGWNPTKLNKIIRGTRGITPSAALDLSEAFGTTPEFWLNAQRAWGLWEVLQHRRKIIKEIKNKINK